MLLSKKIIGLTTASLAVALVFQNCAPPPGFSLMGEQQLSSVSAASAIDLKFNETNQDVMTSQNPSVGFSATSASVSFVLKCYVNAVATSSCASPISLASAADGDISLRIVAQSSSGQPLKEISRVFRVDRSPPVLTIVSKPADQIGGTNATVQYTVTDNLSAASDIAVQCALDNTAYTSCASPKNFTGLAAGAHVIKIKAVDRAGNSSNEMMLNFSVVIGIPTVTITSAPAAVSNSTTATFVFSGASTNSTITGYECSVDDGTTYSACTSPRVYNSLVNGTYNFAVRAVDAQGAKSGAATQRFAVDTVLPSTPVVSSNLMSPTKETALNLTFSSTDASGIMKYECSFDGSAFAACTSPKAYSGLSVASHTFKVKSTDLAGNVSSEGAYTIVVESAVVVPPPTDQPQQIISQSGVTVNRHYITSVFLDIFGNRTDVRAEVDKWVFVQSSQFGGGCDVNSTASGQDCGPVDPPWHPSFPYKINYELSSVPISLSVSTIRQSYMLKACENISSLNNSMNYVREKMSVAANTEISDTVISNMYLLFFRDDAPSADMLKVLRDFNNDLKTNNESLENRWRAMFSFICELPGWQSP